MSTRRTSVLRSAAGLALVAMIGASAALVAAEASIAADAAARFSPYVGADGTITRPRGFRRDWVHLGSWVVADEAAPGHGVHDVYAEPAAVDHYRAHGAFPDGAVLVKEIRGVERATLTTGDALWAGAPKVWFVMVKDAKGRFPDDPRWGHGWGWELFLADHPDRGTVTDLAADCLGCHAPARSTDWVYVQGYPTLAR